ncbi:MAG: holin [Lentihominibacter sp.]|nr:holin [Lentihominibacter sp.]
MLKMHMLVKTRDRSMRRWIKKAGVRAVRTVAQTAAAMIGTAVVLSDVNWLEVVSASVLAGILSVLMSVAGLLELRDEEEKESGGIL